MHILVLKEGITFFYYSQEDADMWNSWRT